MNLRIRRLEPSECVTGSAYLYVGAQTVDTPAVLEFFGEMPKVQTGTDGDGNAEFDGPTAEGWQPVPIVGAE
jgi:hypothetical protein